MCVCVWKSDNEQRKPTVAGGIREKGGGGATASDRLGQADRRQLGPPL